MKKYIKNNNGLTLVELLASTVLIMLILSTFLMMFAQSAKTNVASETIVDSTYTAQTEMEKIYGLSKKITPINKLSAFPSAGYGTPKNLAIGGMDWIEFTKKISSSNETIKIRLESKAADVKMTRIIIEVYEGTKTNASAKMENVLVWEGTP
ncbi:hypothetical protein QWY15_06880 [Planococcus sp. N064]|uniref:Prepilin-type N-terminal cleavage/methylation domain-containing protein n=1 Tax=Planococcus liqunii TaxID=3058394 RepID=A0ABT8MQH9_9BACL|nr:hypothetical protein [Planococcus sp. N064]MDN7227021.1 hypothetical protein [Planococcus sp. N064]